MHMLMVSRRKVSVERGAAATASGGGGGRGAAVPAAGGDIGPRGRSHARRCASGR
ncbi:hypothetical protein OCAE111667_14645 [Occultella aeris]|uniref:Uncharacterized protein n=1 Tax=Occultella aeris TaxID=2761496 RepID=A0A7M4DEZ8_9MICO|nr:hypothetical protein HALOF300_00689 [Occultella aeris]